MWGRSHHHLTNRTYTCKTSASRHKLHPVNQRCAQIFIILLPSLHCSGDKNISRLHFPCRRSDLPFSLSCKHLQLSLKLYAIKKMGGGSLMFLKFLISLRKVAGQLGLKSSWPLSQLGPGSRRPESTLPGVFLEHSRLWFEFCLGPNIT